MGKLEKAVYCYLGKKGSVHRKIIDLQDIKMRERVIFLL